MNLRTTCWTIAAVLVLGSAGIARANGPAAVPTEVAVPEARPWAVSAQVTYSTDGPPASTSYGVNLERRLVRHLFVDADVERGLSYAVPTKNGLLHFEPKVAVGARARATVPLGTRDQHALFLGAGPRYSASDAYPDLWQGRVEVGYTFRAAGGFSLLYAVGGDFVLADRPAPVAPGDCTTASCLGPLHVGRAIGAARIALGYAF